MFRPVQKKLLHQHERFFEERKFADKLNLKNKMKTASTFKSVKSIITVDKKRV